MYTLGSGLGKSGSRPRKRLWQASEILAYFTPGDLNGVSGFPEVMELNEKDPELRPQLLPLSQVCSIPHDVVGKQPFRLES